MSSATDRIEQLIERFDRNIDAYRGGGYKEMEIRREFIDPFFAALGWDVDNRSGYAEAYKDVIHEDAIKVGGSTKAPDYCFRIGGTRKFFVEAKKPAVNIAQDAHPAYQLRRYAWSAKLPLSILTDFEEFAVYDCRIRPRPADKPSAARTIYCTYDTYLDNWDRIEGIFSKQAVLQGSFDKYVTGRKKRGTAEVDAEFLREIETWRAALARNIALRNPRLNVREINFAVQRTIDRIIFLRMAEDRGVEDYATLQGLINGTEVYARLMEMFRRADDRYNSGLFHFNPERGRDEAPDTLTPALAVDDKVLKDIFSGLYYPASPYEFSVLPADILGNVYEQFLGKVIHLTAGHQARVEDKPEVKKAGGVYYTPKYIVDYIVKHTVGALIGAEPPSDAQAQPERAKDGSPGRPAGENATPAKPGAPRGRKKTPAKPRTPAQISKLRILDPACGSGSFLLGAYRFLLDYHRDWYLADGAENHRKEIYQGAGGQWYLATAEKKRILLNNIYGVDIDSQAVEVTKLNLLLCVLENENQNTVGQLALIHQRVLPDLSSNIKCGNSLIGPDFYEGKQLNLFDTEAQYRINAFDWHAEFPNVFKSKNPGFDAVVGNPPYGIEFDVELKEYLERSTPAFIRNNDLFVAFTEEALALLANGGQFGFIMPNTYLLGPYFDGLKQCLLDRALSIAVLDFGFNQVFPKPNVFTCITLVEKRGPTETRRAFINIGISEHPEAIADEPHRLFTLSSEECDSLVWKRGSALPRRLSECFPCLEEHCIVKDVGLNYWTVGRGKKRGGSIADRVLYRGEKKAKEDRTYLKGRNLDRYELNSPDTWLRCDWDTRINPAVDKFRFDDQFLSQEKLVYRQTADRLRCSLDPHGYLTDKTVHSIVWRRGPHGRESYLYLLGILNSQLFVHLYSAAACEAGRTFAQVKIYRVRALPFRLIDFADPMDVARHERMVGLVEQMLQLRGDVATARTDHAKTLLQRQIDATDRQIDQLVYELYGLTEEEVAIVEGATG